MGPELGKCQSVAISIRGDGKSPDTKVNDKHLQIGNQVFTLEITKFLGDNSILKQNRAIIINKTRDPVERP